MIIRIYVICIILFRQQEWDAAMLARKRYKESILSDRIYDYTMHRSKAKLNALRPGIFLDDSITSSKFGCKYKHYTVCIRSMLTICCCVVDNAPGTPVRSREFFTATQQRDEDLILNIEYAKYLGDSYSLPSLKPSTLPNPHLI
jgi:hypothetical protein